MQRWERAPGGRIAGIAAALHGSSDEGRAPAAAIRVVPEGCADLLLTWTEGAFRAEIFGPKTRAILVRDPAPAEKLAVALRPGAVRRLTGVPAAALRDRAVPCADLSAHLRDRLSPALEAASWPERMRRVEGALAAAAAPAPEGSDLVAAAVARIQASGGRVRVGALCAGLGVGARRLHRLFEEQVGLSPKRFARSVRFLRAWRALAAGRPPLEVALACGYADQPHLGREVRELAGVPPGGAVRSVQDGASGAA